MFRHATILYGMIHIRSLASSSDRRADRCSCSSDDASSAAEIGEGCGGGSGRIPGGPAGSITTICAPTGSGTGERPSGHHRIRCRRDSASDAVSINPSRSARDSRRDSSSSAAPIVGGHRVRPGQHSNPHVQQITRRVGGDGPGTLGVARSLRNGSIGPRLGRGG